MSTRRLVRWTVMVALTCAAALALSATQAAPGDKQPFSVTGLYLESCSCSPPCACELVGLVHGCQGVGLVTLTTGKYGGTDLSGVKIAYAVAPGDWVRLYLDVPKPAQHAAAEAFGRAAFAAFGKIEAVKDGKIAVEGSAGKYTATVDGGAIMKFSTEPVLGEDGRRPVGHTNAHNTLTTTLLQAKTVSATYKDGDRSFTLQAGTNSFFNDRVRRQGQL